MKKVISFILAAFMLIGTLPMLASAEDSNPNNFDPFVIPEVSGYSTTEGFIIPMASFDTLGITSENHETLIGYRIRGTVTKADGTKVLVKQLPILSTKYVKGADEKEYIRTWVGALPIDNGWWNQTTPAPYTAELTLSPIADIDVTNFEPIKLAVTKLGADPLNGSDYNKLVVKDEFPFEITADTLNGCVINGTLVYNGTNATATPSVNFNNVAIIKTTVRADGAGLDLLLEDTTAKYAFVNEAINYTVNLTISPAPPVQDVTNFDPFEITVKAVGSDTNRNKKFVIEDAFPFDVTADQLVGCVLNGSLSYTGSVEGASTYVPFNNVAIVSQSRRSETELELFFVQPEGYTIPETGWNVTDFEFDITISPAPAEPPAPPVSDEDVTNFATRAINVTAIGGEKHNEIMHRRFVIDNCFDFDITVADQLAGCVLNGTITYTGSTEGISKSVPFVNVPVAYQPLRDDHPAKLSLDFLEPNGYTIEQGTGKYTFNLTISPAITADNFAPFKINVEKTGSPDDVLKRLLITNTLNIDNAVANQLTGCYLNGTVTYGGDGAYSKVVIFKNVPVTQEARTSDARLSLDFDVPAGYSICLGEGEDKKYTWNLTLSREQAGDIAITDADVAGNGVALTVDNDTFDTINGLKLIAAAYNADNKMVDLDIIDLPSIAAGASTPVDSIAFTATDWTYSRVFIWYDLATMIPISNAVCVSK